MDFTIDIIITILILLLSIGIIALRTAIEIREIERIDNDEI